MATLFKRPEAKPDQVTYTIDLPGGADLFKFIIPAYKDTNLKKARIMRMLTHKSTVPEPLQWIPDVVTQIDDAQDILTTALWLGKPLIRKLPSRFIPFVGWALTLSDAANLINMLLSIGMTPGLQKADIHKMLKDAKFAKKDIAEKLKKFKTYGGVLTDIHKSKMPDRVARHLRAGGWRTQVANVLQAAQASETITGIGLTLGSIMGAASDLMWTPYQLAKGNRVIIRQPPKADPLNKAYRFLTMTPKQFQMRDILSPEDHAIMLAAQNMAVGIVLDSGIPIDDYHADYALGSQVPLTMPWEESSIQALQEEGFDLSKENYYKPYIPLEEPTMIDSIDLAHQSIGTTFPPGWTREDPLPPGVTVNPIYIFGRYWTPDQPLPVGVTVDPGAAFPLGWTPNQPLPPGVTVDPRVLFPSAWKPENPVPFGVTITPPEYGMAQKREIGTGDEGTIFWLVAKEAAEDAIKIATGLSEEEVWSYSPAQISAIKLAEYNLKLVPGIWPIDRMKWFNTALAMAEASRRKYCSPEDFKNAAQMYGGLMYPKY